MFDRCGGGRGGGVTAKMSETRRTFPNALLPMFEGINVTHVSGTDLLRRSSREFVTRPPTISIVAESS
jgi:hypothetical protein